MELLDSCGFTDNSCPENQYCRIKWGRNYCVAKNASSEGYSCDSDKNCGPTEKCKNINNGYDECVNPQTYKNEGNACSKNEHCGVGEYCKQIRFGIDRCEKENGSRLGNHCGSD